MRPRPTLGQPERVTETAPGGPPAPTETDNQVAVGEAIDRYVLLEQIGSGAMGVVYAAYDLALERRVALKLLRHPGDSAQGREHQAACLLREARLMAKLAHPNIVAVHDAGTH